MSTYAIGDLQGCFATLESMLRRIRFRRGHDHLWFVGDLVNRGAGSLECLRFVRSLGNNGITVLGNHDLHLLAVAEGVASTHRSDTLDNVLNAPDRETLIHWLRQQKLLHIEGTYAMVHAGLLPQWNWQQAHALAREVETQLTGPRYRNLLQQIYGDEPRRWHDTYRGIKRARFVINVMTRMRVLHTNSASPELDLNYKGEATMLPDQLFPWFKVNSVRRSSRTIIAGHWSALGLHQAPRFIGLDTGCIWGGPLTAVRLEDRKIIQVACAEISQPPR